MLVLTALVGLAFVGVTIGQAQNPFLLIPIAAETVVGGIVARRRPDNPMGWVFLGVGGLAGILSISVGLTFIASDAGGAIPWWGVLAAWVGNWVWYPLFYLLTTLTLLVYPSGLLSRRWRPVLWVSLTGLVCVVVAAALMPELPVGFDSNGTATRTVDNPISPSFIPDVAAVEDIGFVKVLGLISIGCFFAALASSILRVRRSRGIEREQMRWFGFALAVIVAFTVLSLFIGSAGSSPWANLLQALVLSFFVVSCGIAILRYRLYDIDRIISRTASYALVTGVLVAVYLVVVTAMSQLLPDSNSLAVAAATLAVAAAFRPVFRRMHAVVDRRFNRSHFDAEQTVESFAARLRDEVSADAVTSDLVGVVDRVFQPASATVWIRRPEGSGVRE